ncbi:MAG: ribbon-helix-helix domain-containing protein [Patescibacteria group bacterium]|nr:ribbon-helix-helix domain-containing protein [Patescibacteria group bacterium]
MREVINISLPETMAKTIKKAVKTGDFSSTSEFFRHLVRQWQEDLLLKEINKGRKEIATGKGKKFNSLKDLR